MTGADASCRNRKLRRPMNGKRQSLVLSMLLVCLMFAPSLCSAQNQQQPLPDAPSAQRPAQQLPAAPTPQLPSEPATSRSVPPPPQQESPAPPPVTTVPQGGATPGPGSDRDRLFTLTKNVNFV